jgi:hypothetical protein
VVAQPNRYEGSVTAAATSAGARWALAGGIVSSDPGTETYLLVANPNGFLVSVTFDIGIGGAQQRPECRVSVAIPAFRRYTAPLKSLVCPASWVGTPSYAVVAGVIESYAGVPIVVERATYWSTPAQVWAAGASTLLTKLP